MYRERPEGLQVFQVQPVKLEDIAATGHKYGEAVVLEEATCTTPGKQEAKCEVCGDTKTSEIPAKGHSYDDGVVTKEATCAKAGVKTHTCSACGDTYTEEIPATNNHTWDEGKVTKKQHVQRTV